MKDFSEAIRISPKDADNYYNRGNSYLALGKNEEATKDYDQALSLDSKLAAAYSQSRHCLRFSRRARKKLFAISAETIEQQPENADAYYNRGLANAELGKTEAAIEDYSESIRLEPKDAEAPYNRGLAYLRTEKYEYAVRDFSEVIRIQPRNAEAHVYRGIGRLYQGKEKRQTQIFKKPSNSTRA